MPNEQINYPKWRPALDSTAGAAAQLAQLAPVVQVGWAAASGHDEGAVQLSLTLMADVPMSQLDSEGKPRKWPESDERQVALSRTEINKLIRTLRRARDQAFGQDE